MADKWKTSCSVKNSLGCVFYFGLVFVIISCPSAKYCPLLFNTEIIKINTSRSVGLSKINDRHSLILVSASQLRNTTNTFHAHIFHAQILFYSTIPADYPITVYTSAKCCHFVIFLCNIEIKKSTLLQHKQQTDPPTPCCHIKEHTC